MPLGNYSSGPQTSSVNQRSEYDMLKYDRAETICDDILDVGVQCVAFRSLVTNPYKYSCYQLSESMFGRMGLEDSERGNFSIILP